ncbi:uncharacterized protein LOC131158534 [Malania oleifera]|uniref:uncharacterized protein LOC131158534 n=1 Tax=Malania oleifera TaxID=397392 RepID=UPI0025AEB2EA|nr:uncharacterized protein LOC131158534 [Malania oleifera]
MPKLFQFDDNEMTTLPVWVQLTNLPLELWFTNALGRICSEIGRPLYADKMTTGRERLTYARILVEVDVAKEIKCNVKIFCRMRSCIEKLAFENPKTIKIMSSDIEVPTTEGDLVRPVEGKDSEDNAIPEKELRKVEKDRGKIVTLAPSGIKGVGKGVAQYKEKNKNLALVPAEKKTEGDERTETGIILICWNPEKVHIQLIQNSAQSLDANGSLNSILFSDEKKNGLPVKAYETKDMRYSFIESGLSDLSSSGCFLTWSNGRVWSKLDKVMVNSVWAQTDFRPHAHFHPLGHLSDHSPCVVSLLDKESKGRRPFKFFNMWSQHDNFQSAVREGLYTKIQGSNQFRFARKLTAMKRSLRALNSRHFPHISERVDRVSSELLEAQQMLQCNPDNENLQRIVLNKRNEATRLDKANRSFLAKLAKNDYLKKCDRGTSVFHSLMKRHLSRNHITSISMSNGCCVEHPICAKHQYYNYCY